MYMKTALLLYDCTRFISLASYGFMLIYWCISHSLFSLLNRNQHNFLISFVKLNGGVRRKIEKLAQRLNAIKNSKHSHWHQTKKMFMPVCVRNEVSHCNVIYFLRWHAKEQIRIRYWDNPRLSCKWACQSCLMSYKFWSPIR